MAQNYSVPPPWAPPPLPLCHSSRPIFLILEDLKISPVALGPARWSALWVFNRNCISSEVTRVLLTVETKGLWKWGDLTRNFRRDCRKTVGLGARETRLPTHCSLPSVSACWAGCPSSREKGHPLSPSPAGSCPWRASPHTGDSAVPSPQQRTSFSGFCWF